MNWVDWWADPANWVFLAVGLMMVYAAFRVVTSPNVVHAALYLVVTLGGSAALYLLLSAAFVAWVLVLVYIGAVIVLFLFGIMITRAPTGREPETDHRHKLPAALVSGGLLAVLVWGVLTAFGDRQIRAAGEGTPTEILGDSLLGRFVLPFELVGFVLLAALIGGITLARRDRTPDDTSKGDQP